MGKKFKLSVFSKPRAKRWTTRLIQKIEHINNLFNYILYQQIDLSVDVVSVYAEDYNIGVDQPLTDEAV